MLCDRLTTNTKKSQPGFIAFVTLPLISKFANIIPQLEEGVENLKNNSKKWDAMEETEEEKKMYEPRVSKGIEVDEIGTPKVGNK